MAETCRLSPLIRHIVFELMVDLLRIVVLNDVFPFFLYPASDWCHWGLVRVLLLLLLVSVGIRKCSLPFYP